LRNYGINQVTYYLLSAGVNGTAFDGANIWMANASTNTVTKFQANNGTVLSTVSAGSNPLGVAFDGANI
jgi:YVTN family beta-propeller protein